MPASPTCSTARSSSASVSCLAIKSDAVAEFLLLALYNYLIRLDNRASSNAF